MNRDLEESYCTWLCSHVSHASVRGRKTHWALLWQLFTTEFVWLIPNDDNRVEDGRDLRYEFLVESEYPDPDEDFMLINCSVLEMLIALCRRIAFLTDTPIDAWFWHIMHNLGIDDCTDDKAPGFTDEVAEVLRAFIWRDYAPDGKGGLFPLRRPDRDQREVEIWYQMGAYILENS